MDDSVDTTDRTFAQDLRLRVLSAASALLAEQGVSALTTRAVATAASVQAPALYRLFGEKRGLLHALAEHELAAFIAEKHDAAPDPDPVRDLIRGWDNYVAFCLAKPAVFAIMNELGTPRPPATLAGLAVLRGRVERVARTGRLGVPVERAVEMIHNAGIGTIAALLATPVPGRDPLLAPMARDAVLAAILVDPAPGCADSGVTALAIALGARLDEAESLTPGECLLLSELLGRLAATGGTRAP